MEGNLGGTKLGKYEIQAEVGRGGMGVVYKGYDPALDRHVAVKVLAPHLVWEQEFVKRFLREARAAARLKHAHIVTIHDVGQAAGWYYFVMEYLEGSTLTEIIQERGPLPPDEALSILRPVADALDYAHHRGLVHRDVKPGNVIVDATGHVTLTDFGIARAARETRLTATGTIVGTPEYMSPEQAKGSAVGASSDLYSLAVVVYEILSGRVPFEAESALALLHMIVYDPLPSICQVNPDLPAGVEAVMRKALAKEPDDRYEEVGAFVGALERALAGEEIEKTPTLVMAPERPATVSAPAVVPTPEEIEVASSYVQPVSAPAPEPSMAAGPEPEPERLKPERTKVMSPATQPTVPSRRRVPTWAWALGALAVLALVVGVAIGIGGGYGDTTSTSGFEIVPTAGSPAEGLNGVYYYGFNTTLEPFDDPLVRQAFAAALDRPALVDLAKALNPEREYAPATTFTPPDILGLDLYGEVGWPYDPDYANGLLEEAGYPRGEGLAAITLWYNETEDRFHQEIAEAVREQWHAVLGIKVDLGSKPSDLYYSAVYDHQVWHMGWNADHVDPHNFLHDGICSGYNNDFFDDWEGEYASAVEAIADAPDEATRRAKISEFSSRACTHWSPTRFRWDHDEYEALLQAALQEYDEEMRREKYVRAEQILCETEAVLIPLFHYYKDE